MNHKRIERLLRLERLPVGQRPRRKRVAQTRVPAPVPTRPDEAGATARALGGGSTPRQQSRKCARAHRLPAL
jgi:hypothetical protein